MKPLFRAMSRETDVVYGSHVYSLLGYEGHPWGIARGGWVVVKQGASSELWVRHDGRRCYFHNEPEAGYEPVVAIGQTVEREDFRQRGRVLAQDLGPTAPRQLLALWDLSVLPAFAKLAPDDHETAELLSMAWLFCRPWNAAVAQVLDFATGFLDLDFLSS